MRKQTRYNATLATSAQLHESMGFQYESFHAFGPRHYVPPGYPVCVLDWLPDESRQFLAVEYEGRKLYGWVNRSMLG